MTHRAGVVAVDVTYTNGGVIAGTLSRGALTAAMEELRTVALCMPLLVTSIAWQSLASRFVVSRLLADKATSNSVSSSDLTKGGFLDCVGQRVLLSGGGCDWALSGGWGLHWDGWQRPDGDDVGV